MTWTTNSAPPSGSSAASSTGARRCPTVAQSLVTRQRAFLDHGLAHLQPLALTEVAAALGLHASTVHRVVTNKYLATAHGIVALTSFFQSGIESSGGETMSSLTVKDRIKTVGRGRGPRKAPHRSAAR